MRYPVVFFDSGIHINWETMQWKPFVGITLFTSILVIQGVYTFSRDISAMLMVW